MQSMYTQWHGQSCKISSTMTGNHIEETVNKIKKIQVRNPND